MMLAAAESDMQADSPSQRNDCQVTTWERSGACHVAGLNHFSHHGLGSGGLDKAHRRGLVSGWGWAFLSWVHKR